MDLWYRSPENAVLLLVDSSIATVEQLAETALDHLFEDLDHLWLLETLGPGNRLYLEKGQPAVSGVTKVDPDRVLRPGNHRFDGDKHYKWWIGWRRPGREESVFAGIPEHLRSRDADGPASGLFTTSRTAIMDFDFGAGWRLIFRNLADVSSLSAELPKAATIVAAPSARHSIRQYDWDDDQ